MEPTITLGRTEYLALSGAVKALGVVLRREYMDAYVERKQLEEAIFAVEAAEKACREA